MRLNCVSGVVCASSGLVLVPIDGITEASGSPSSISRHSSPLDALLKLTGLCDTGGKAKIAIAAGRVKIAGAVELRRRCKVRAGQTVAFEGRTIAVR